MKLESLAKANDLAEEIRSLKIDTTGIEICKEIQFVTKNHIPICIKCDDDREAFAEITELTSEYRKQLLALLKNKVQKLTEEFEALP